MSSLCPCPYSPAAASPLDDDDLLSEVLLRLPPHPSSLPRASLICKRWRRLASDPGLCRRFRRRHRSNPPLLGFFHEDFGLCFEPTLEAPNRFPPERFSLQYDHCDRFHSLGCRHGLVLIFVQARLQLLVWDPVTGDQHRLAIPPGFDATKTVISGAVLRTSGDDEHFQVVLIGPDDDEEIQRRRVLACVYSSETGVWGNLVSTPIPCQNLLPYVVSLLPAVLVGDSLYWILEGGSSPNILEFDLERQSLAVIRSPVNVPEDEADHAIGCGLTVMRAEGGGLGLFFFSDFTAQIWKRKTDCNGVASWMLRRTFELDKLLSLNSEEEKEFIIIDGFAEENNLVFLWTPTGVLTVQLNLLQLKILSETKVFSHIHPFESVYTTETSVGGGHDVPGLLHNT